MPSKPNQMLPNSSQVLRLFLLGTWRVEVKSQVIDAPQWQRRRKASALLKLLALAPSHRLHREQLIEQLWPNSSPDAGANNFHQALYHARHILESASRPTANWLLLENDFITLSPDDPLAIDVEAFEASAAEAHRGQDLALYKRALDWYGGELLPDDRYDDWVISRRETLQQEFIALLAELAELYQHRQEYPAAIETFKRIVTTEPTHEPAHRALMELYALIDERDKALAQFEQLQATLRKDLDIEPDPTSQQLHQKLLSEKLRPLPVASITLAHNLPIQLTSFIGREEEIDTVLRQLTATRLLTLTGPGGCGKTRLALQVASHTLGTFSSGVWFIDLAPLSDSAFVPRVVANVLGVSETTSKSIIETLIDSLRSKHTLILLDNCEHLIEACAQLCDSLLRACPNLSILATSREPLRSSGEIVWLVPSLALPDPDRLPAVQDLSDYSAIRLFVERAHAMMASFDLTSANASAIARLCFHLDGIPLAIELAAAWVNVLAVEQILARLDDRFRLLTRASRTALNRQQTLRAAIDWSYDSLSEAERVLFRRLAVFAGGWRLEAAESITSSRAEGDELNSLLPSQVLEVLSRLVDKSLVVVAQLQGEVHYRMLETIRDYARQRLDESGETDVIVARHCVWCIEFLEQVNPRFWGTEHSRWVNRLEREHENIRAALAWCVERDPQAGLRLANLLEQFWVLRGYTKEGLGWLEKLLSRAPEPTTLRAKGILSQLLLSARAGDRRGEVENRVNEIVAVYKRVGNQVEQVRTYLGAGALTFVTLSLEKAKPLFESSLALARDIEFDAGSACAEQFLGIQAAVVGDYERAESLLEQSTLRLRALETEPEVTSIFLNLNQMPFTYGVHQHWRIVDEESLLLIRRVSADSAIGYALANQASAARAAGKDSRAGALYEASRAHFFEIGDQSGLSQVLGQQGYLFVSTRDPSRARAALETSLALRRELGERRGIGRSLNNLANAATLSGDYRQARTWLDESLALFQEMLDKPGLAQTFNHLANWALEQHDFILAESFYTQSLNLFNEFAPRGAGYILLNLAECARGAGNVDSMRAFLERAHSALEAYGDHRSSAIAEGELRNKTEISHLA